jgi:hypothetical protein
VYAGRPGNLVRLADLADGPYVDLNSLVKINNRGYAVFWGQLAAGITGATLHEFGDASHALPIQCAGRLNGLLLDHFGGVEPTRGVTVRGRRR